MANSSSDQPFTVALTGGIASGKTLVSDEFKKLNVAIIDADIIAHQVVQAGWPALLEIKKAFGPGILGKDGQLRRRKLRELIFTNPTARTKLESILHPIIRDEIKQSILAVKAPYCIVVIPLLVEGGSYPMVNRILVVDVDTKTQISRLMARDDSNRQQAEQALASQANRQQRLAIADDVLENSGGIDEVRAKVAHLHQRYLKMAELQVVTR